LGMVLSPFTEATGCCACCDIMPWMNGTMQSPSLAATGAGSSTCVSHQNF